MSNHWGCYEIVFLRILEKCHKSICTVRYQTHMSACLGLWMVLLKSLHPLSDLGFSLCFTGEFVRLLNSGLDTKGYTNGTGCSPASALATVSSYLHNKSIFYFNAPLLLLFLPCRTEKHQEKSDIESVHHSSIGLKRNPGSPS